MKQVLYLAIISASQKWTMPIHNGKSAMSRFIIMFEDCYDHQGNVIEKQHQGKSLKLHRDNLNRLSGSELNGQKTHYGYDVFGQRLFKQTQRDLTLFGWDGDLMIWESVKSNNNIQSYTKHYLYEPNSFIPLVQTGYSGFIKLLDTPDYRQYQTQA